jgi:predicted amidohydrolase
MTLKESDTGTSATTLRIAGYQIPVGREVDENAERICGAIEQAAEAGVDILLTPEGSLSDYRPDFDANQVESALERVTAEARRRGVGLALGTCFEESNGKRYNQLRFYRADGEYLGFHAKILLCKSLSNPSGVGEADQYATVPLRVFHWSRDIDVAGLICNDLWANPGCTPQPDPHLTIQLAGMGARIVLHAVNGASRREDEWSDLARQFHETNLRKRAKASKLWVVTVDNCDPIDSPCSSPGGVIAPDGSWAFRSESKGEQLFVHEIEL